MINLDTSKHPWNANDDEDKLDRIALTPPPSLLATVANIITIAATWFVIIALFVVLAT